MMQGHTPKQAVTLIVLFASILYLIHQSSAFPAFKCFLKNEEHDLRHLLEVCFHA